MAHELDLTSWLLDTDPTLRWQVERDVVGAPEAVWSATRARTATEGFGNALLARQDADGQWAGGAFFPADFDFDGPEAGTGAGQPWTATSWSLLTLRDWGVDAAVLGDTAARIAANSRWEYDALPYWDGEVDCCINAATLANGVWLGADVGGIAAWMLDHRQADGGWNCEWVEGSTRSSFHSTLNVLRALLWVERAVGPSGAVGDVEVGALRAARHAGEEYLLERHLLRRKTDGALVGDWVGRFAYPFRWRYDVLRALDHFREAAQLDRTEPDGRLADAVGIVRAARRPDGRWTQGRRDPGRVWFEVDVPEGEPSPWLTLVGTRVLDWWDAAGR